MIGRAVLSFGSNLGDRVSHIVAGLEVVAQFTDVLAVSDLYETDAVGVTDQPDFLNLVALIDTDDAELALTAAHAAEESQGRLRAQRWGPRSLDVDIVAMGSRASSDPRLTIPHPRAAERAFVLLPWLAIDPTATLPGVGTVAEALRNVDVTGVRRFGPTPAWWR